MRYQPGRLAWCLFCLQGALALDPPPNYWCSDPLVSWADCATSAAPGTTRMMEQLPGIKVPVPAWWETMPAYTRQCPSCTPIWLLCPSQDTGGWDGGDMLRTGGMMMMELVNRQQWLLPGYEMMCEYYNDHCVGETAQQIITSRLRSDPDKYVGIGQTGCSACSVVVSLYTTISAIPFMSWAAGVPALSDRLRYRNFFRTRIPRSAVPNAWLKVAEHCGWKHITLIFGNSNTWGQTAGIMRNGILAAGSIVELDMEILDPLGQADGLMTLVKQKRLRIMAFIGYETTWRALLCSSMYNGLRGLVWMVFGFYNKNYFNILDAPDVSQWSCDTATMREASFGAVFGTTTMWASAPEAPLYCDRDKALTTTQFKADYFAKAPLLSTDEMVGRGGKDYRVSAPREAGAQAADGVCIYAQALSSMLGLHPEGTKPFSGNTYTLDDLRQRGDNVYEDFLQLFQAVRFNGVSGSPYTFNCKNLPSDRRCDSECRNDPGCTGDSNGATLVFQFVYGDGIAADSEFPTTFMYDVARELEATTDAERALALTWYNALAFPYGGSWGGPSASAPSVVSTPGENGASCVAGYHLISGTAYCVPDDMYPSCPSGSAYDFTETRCIGCPLGKAFNTDQETCDDCQAGWHGVMDNGLAACRACPMGKFASQAGMPECLPCSPGTSCVIAATEETPCEVGHYADQPGSAECKPCPAGTYTNETQREACDPCPNKKMTMEQVMVKGVNTWVYKTGSVAEAACMCDVGARPDGAGGCITCGEGMDCRGEEIFILPGYMSLAADPTSAYLCVNVDSCPGGGPGTCNTADKIATEIGCSVCKEGYFETDGLCEKCDPLSALITLAAAILGFAFIAFITIDGSKSLLYESEGRLLVGMVAGITMEAMQTLSLIGELDMMYISPIAGFLDIFAVFAFDIKLLRSECVHGSTPVGTYVSRQMVAPFIIPMVFAAILLKKAYLGSKAPALSRDTIVPPLINGVGVFWCEFFIAICVSATSPFVCYPHPTGQKSVQTYPQVLCYEEGPHAGLIAAAAIAVLLIPIPFASLVGWATWKFPDRIVKMDRRSDLFLQTTRFMFVDVRPPAYVFPAALLFKNFVVCMVPVIFGGDGGLQSLGIAVVLIVFRIIQEKLHPFRIEWCNTFDAALQGCLILAVIVGAITTDFEPDMDILRALLWLVTLGFGCALGLPLLYTLYFKFAPKSGKNHDYFICHNKSNAAAQCLLLKHFVEAATQQHVYLDNSTVLDGMDKYLESVRDRPEKFVAYLTSRALSLPTFVAELVMAFFYDVKVTTVKTPGFTAPSSQQLDNLEHHIDTMGITLLILGVTLQRARDAIDRLMSPEVPCIEIDDSLDGINRVKGVASLLLGNDDAPSVKNNALPQEAGVVVVSSDDRSDEAVAAASYIRLGLLNSVSDCYCLSDYTDDLRLKSTVVVNSRAVIFVLSESSLESVSQITIMANTLIVQEKAQQDGLADIAYIPVALPSFRFPTSHRFYDEIVGHIIVDGDPAFIKKLVQSLGHKDIVSFPLQGSEAVLHHYIQVIQDSIPAKTDKHRGSSRKPLGRVSVERISKVEAAETTTTVI